MRYAVYDEEGRLFRKFWDEFSAKKFLQEGWKLVVTPKPRKPKPNIVTHGEARW